MASAVILVNGLPGAGKTTLSRPLAAALGVPLISKDHLKETFADIAAGRVESRRLGQIALDTMWELVAAIPGEVLAESWWFGPRDLPWVEAGLIRSGRPAVVEVWCDVPVEVAWRRYAARARHPIHPDADAAREGWQEWEGGAAPLGLGPVVRVDATAEVDVADLALEVRRAL